MLLLIYLLSPSLIICVTVIVLSFIYSFDCLFVFFLFFCLHSLIFIMFCFPGVQAVSRPPQATQHWGVLTWGWVDGAMHVICAAWGDLSLLQPLPQHWPLQGCLPGRAARGVSNIFKDSVWWRIGTMWWHVQGQYGDIQGQCGDMFRDSVWWHVEGQCGDMFREFFLGGWGWGGPLNYFWTC